MADERTALMKEVETLILKVTSEMNDSLKAWVQATINHRLDEMKRAESEQEEVTEDEQMWQNLVAFVKKYPKSCLWMLSGFLVGLGSGYTLACTGAWGTVLVIVWAMKSEEGNNEKS